MKVNIAHCLIHRNQLSNLISFECDYYFCACSYFCCLCLTIVCQTLSHTHTNSYHITVSGAASRIRRVAHFSSLPVWLTNLITGQLYVAVCVCLIPFNWFQLGLVERIVCVVTDTPVAGRPETRGNPRVPKGPAWSQFIWCINQQKLKCSHENQLKSRW